MRVDCRRKKVNLGGSEFTLTHNKPDLLPMPTSAVNFNGDREFNENGVSKAMELGQTEKEGK